MDTTPAPASRIDLTALRRMKAERRKIAMLTAYDYPTAALAQAAGVHSLLIGDSMGTVLLGQPTTRDVPLDLMITLGEAVRRGAPRVYLIGDLPFVALQGGAEGVVHASKRFRDEAGCDGVKLEVGPHDVGLVARLAEEGFEATAHLGLRPQQITSPNGYRAQARDADTIRDLVADAKRMAAAGAAMLLLEAVPNEASQAVLAEVDVPVIGCGAGPACDGHVLVTQDMLGLGTIRPPRFVPLHAELSKICEKALRRYVHDIADGAYPAPEHVYHMRVPPEHKPD